MTVCLTCFRLGILVTSNFHSTQYEVVKILDLTNMRLNLEAYVHVDSGALTKSGMADCICCSTSIDSFLVEAVEWYIYIY